MLENDVLGILFQDNLHHAQYVVRLEDVIKFLLHQDALTLDHLSSIWNAQTGKHEVIVSNIHDLLAKLACHFDTEQLDHLLVCFQNSWGGTAKQMERMLEFIRRLSEDDSEGNVAPKVLQLLWNVAHTVDAPPEIIDVARTSHVNILTYSFIKDKSLQRQEWVAACLKDIANDVCVVHTMRHMESIVSELAYDDNGEQATGRPELLQQLDKQLEVRAMLVANIAKYMVRARQCFATLGADEVAGAGVLSVELHHTHAESLQGRLHFLKFFLKTAMLQLAPASALQIWSALVEQPSCPQDLEACYQWCTISPHETGQLSQAAITALYGEKLLGVPVEAFTMKLFSCFQSMFYAVNEEQGRIVKEGIRVISTNLELLQGKDIMFAVALQCVNPRISNTASRHLIRIHTCLSEELQETAVSLHNAFIQNTAARIKETRVVLESSSSSQGDVQVSQLMMERSLALLIKYVTEWDNSYSRRRMFASHGLAFRGDAFNIEVTFPKTNQPSLTVPVNANETVQTLRERLADHLQMSPTNIQLQHNDRFLDAGQRMMSMSQVGVREKSRIAVRTMAERVDEVYMLQDADADEESKLPTVVVAHNVEIVEQLFDLASGAASTAVRGKATELLQVLPTIVVKLDKLKAGLLAGSTISTEALDALFGEERAFQLLYNVQMICSLQQPTVSGPSPAKFPCDYQVGFASARGARYLLGCIVQVLGRITASGEPDASHYRNILRLCLRMLSQLLQFPVDENAAATGGSPAAPGPPITAAAQSSEWAERSKAQLGPPDKLMEVPVALATLIKLASLAQIGTGESDIRVTYDDQLLAREAIHVLSVVLTIAGELCDLFLQSDAGSSLVTEVLLGCEDRVIRVLVCKLLMQLAVQHATALWGIIKGVLGSRSQPLEGSAQTCEQFFDLLCNIVEHHGPKLVTAQQLSEHLEVELDWLQQYCSTDIKVAADAENHLLSGHMRFCTVIVAMCPDKKAMVQAKLLDGTIRKILFPASHLLAECRDNGAKLLTPEQCCTEFPSRVAKFSAYKLLVELTKGSIENFAIVAKALKRLHFAEELKLVFDYDPDITKRGDSGYCGLKNAGATCYMNSVLQQIFMQPEIRREILSGLAVPEADQADSVLHQMQTIFAHLSKSDMQFFAPGGFWKAYRHFGEPVNIREQQDAHDFFLGLTDQIDEQLKWLKAPKILERVYGGTFADQKKIKSGCDHRYEREEPFMTLQVDVKDCASLEESLEQYVKGDLLEGANAYKCERCDEKRDTIKRMCLKKLPQALVIHQKRFEFDWERDIPVKYNGLFEFPMELDMGPFTVDGLDIRERLAASSESSNGMKLEVPVCNYSLVGVVVHSGQANGGHYYSFVRERHAGGQLHGDSRWLRFDDGDVAEVKIDQEAMQKEFFGGTYASETWDASQRRMVPRQKERWWNGYMLFYERTVSAGPAAGAVAPVDRIPPHIDLLVHEQNIRLLYRREVYSADYFQFVLSLCYVNCEQLMAIDSHPENKELQQLGTLTLDLMLSFILRYAFRTEEGIRGNLNGWIQVVETLVTGSMVAATALLQHFTDQELNSQFLIVCPNADVRETFMRIVLRTILSFHQHDHTLENAIRKAHIYFATCLLPLLQKELFAHWKNMGEVFSLLYEYASQSAFHKQILVTATPDNPVSFLDTAMGLWNQSIGWAKYQMPPCISLYKFVSMMIRNLAFPANFSIPPNPNNSYQPPDANVEFDGKGNAAFMQLPNQPTLFAMLPLIDGICKSQFLISALHQAMGVDELHKAIRYLCYSDKNLYPRVINEVMRLLYLCNASESHMFWGLIRKMIDNENQPSQPNPHVKMDVLTAILIDKEQTQDRYTLFDLLETKYPERSYYALRFMVELADQFPEVENYITSEQVRPKWVWTLRLIWNMCQRNNVSEENETHAFVVLYRKLEDLRGDFAGDADEEEDNSDGDSEEYDENEDPGGVVPSG